MKRKILSSAFALSVLGMPAFADKLEPRYCSLDCCISFQPNGQCRIVSNKLVPNTKQCTVIERTAKHSKVHCDGGIEITFRMDPRTRFGSILATKNAGADCKPGRGVFISQEQADGYDRAGFCKDDCCIFARFRRNTNRPDPKSWILETGAPAQPKPQQCKYERRNRTVLLRWSNGSMKVILKPGLIEIGSVRNLQVAQCRAGSKLAH